MTRKTCVDCGATYDDADTIRRCDRVHDGKSCRGQVEAREVQCLVCLDSGWVDVLGERQRCHRGCQEPVYPKGGRHGGA